MKSEIPDERPVCEEIIDKKYLWALDVNEFDFQKEFDIHKNNTLIIFKLFKDQFLNKQQ